MRDPIVVLKFGSSVLTDEAALPAVLLEIYGEVRQGRRVVAVVSAMGSTTDTLLAGARRRATDPDPACLARLLETGETTSAAILGLELVKAGIPARVLDAGQLDLQVDGPCLDAAPVMVDVAPLHGALSEVPVVVVPGFAGRTGDGAPALLGRGGSDLTALLLAHHLEAATCRLVKDVDGLLKVEDDGALDWSTRYATASWSECVRVGAVLVQPKAVDFARSHGLEFTIASCGGSGGTRVGRLPQSFEDLPKAAPPLRVALAGYGTVGRGVHDWLTGLPGRFTLASLLVKDAGRTRDCDPSLVTDDPKVFLASRPDLVIETIGGTGTAARLIAAARAGGIPVITANKQLLALDPDLLGEVSAGRLSAAAAVGGALPALETAARLAREEPVIAVRGVLNGTCSFILDRLHAGVSYDEALVEAQEVGFAEADPFLDVSGLDVAYKLALLASTAFGVIVTPNNIVRTGLEKATPDRMRRAVARGCRLVLVAEACRAEGGIRARVELRDVPVDHPLASCRGEENILQLETAGGQSVAVGGKGAGRWPTTVAVVGDVMEEARRIGLRAVHPVADLEVPTGRRNATA